MMNQDNKMETERSKRNISDEMAGMDNTTTIVEVPFFGRTVRLKFEFNRQRLMFCLLTAARSLLGYRHLIMLAGIRYSRTVAISIAADR